MADILTPDLCVIGAGPGGLAVAEAAATFGASVVLVERGKLGGLSLNSGSVPAKALLAAAAQAQSLRTANGFGITIEEPRINTRRMHDHLDQVITGLAPRDSEARMKALGIEILKAEARFVDQRTLSAGETLIRARRFVLATGAKSVLPAIPALETVPYFTTETIFDNTRKLTHLVVIGAGPIGLEIAQAYRRLGSTVTVIETGLPLAKSDPELAEIALRRMREEGVDIRENTAVTAIQARSMGIGVAIKSGDAEQLLDASHILVAAGRLPSLDGLDLEKAGIRRSKADNAQLQLTPGLRTTNRRVFAVGDVAGTAQSAHLAALQGERVAANVLFGRPVRLNPELVPHVTYSDPEIAEIGLTEAAAKAKHKSGVLVTRWSFAENDRARADRNGFGTAKLITDDKGRILGAGVVGNGAGELIALFSLAMSRGLSARHLMEFVAPYPAYAEIARRLGLEFYRGQGSNPLLRRLVEFIRYLP
jgi:pyruvate/2-oxoglutarate dehydrogenase complex dihydrolipoamide dehydrogenase (E3) component